MPLTGREIIEIIATPEQRAHQTFLFADILRSVAIICYPVLECYLTFEMRQIIERDPWAILAEIIPESALEILDNILNLSTKLTRRVLEECWTW